ncbi:MAG: hypothetical protein AB8B93_16535 [Pseudomonadales bacterium]
MSKTMLERVALVVSVAVIGAAGWFWYLQLGDVLETLRLAYG